MVLVVTFSLALIMMGSSKDLMTCSIYVKIYLLLFRLTEFRLRIGQRVILLIYYGVGWTMKTVLMHIPHKLIVIGIYSK